jgi:predicted DNA binding CopG/RHH family protein
MHDPWHPETDEEEAAMIERLDPEEREILEAINDPHYVFPPSDSQRVAALQNAARTALAKTARVSIRLTATDLAALKHKAQAEGIPYQTLIGSILHKYVTGQLMPRSCT